MFNVGGGELIVIMLVALIVLGPQRLPGAARQIGKTLGDLRRLSTGFQNEVRSALSDADAPDRMTARRNVLAKEAPIATTEPASGPRLRAEPAEPAEVAEPADAAAPEPERRPSAQARAAARKAAAEGSASSPSGRPPT